MTILRLPEIRITNPSLAETMRACLLRAGLSKASGSSNFVLGNPKAWLGTAYHEVLEKIVEIDLGQESIEDAVERVWGLAIAAQQQRAAAHALNHRFGLPASWPGYYVARASVLLRAKELAARATPDEVAAEKAGGGGPARTIREQEFTAFNGRLLGRPDVIRAGEVVDYKSGVILEHDTAAQIDVVKAAYVRQLRIYGYLIKHRLGWWLSVAFSPAAHGRTTAVLAIEARERKQHVVCLVAGTPGAGKSLLGLNLVLTGGAGRVAGEPAVMLTGNRPLVQVLRGALIADARSRTDDGSARRAVQGALQTLLGYLKEYAAGDATLPPEHVVVFDEAQRAWDEETGQKLLQRRRSEPSSSWRYSVACRGRALYALWARGRRSTVERVVWLSGERRSIGKRARGVRGASSYPPRRRSSGAFRLRWTQRCTSPAAYVPSATRASASGSTRCCPGMSMGPERLPLR